MYQPNRQFMSSLRALDKRLGCNYDRSHEHFVVNYKRAFGDPTPIFMVKTDSGGFRQPDKRDLDFLQSGDLTKEDMKTKLQKSARYMDNVREKKKKDAHDNFRNATKDDKIQLTNAFGRLAGSGKNNATFRRIKPKVRGVSF